MLTPVTCPRGQILGLEDTIFWPWPRILRPWPWPWYKGLGLVNFKAKAKTNVQEIMSQNLCHSYITVIAILLQWTHRNLYVCQVGIERLIVRLVTVSFTRAARSSWKTVILSVSLALVLKDSHWPWPNVLVLGYLVSPWPCVPWSWPWWKVLVNKQHWLTLKYEVDRTTSTELLFFSIEYITWPWPLDLGIMSRDATWVVNTCTKFELETTYIPELRRLKFSTDCQISPNFYVFRGGGGKF